MWWWLLHFVKKSRRIDYAQLWTTKSVCSVGCTKLVDYLYVYEPRRQRPSVEEAMSVKRVEGGTTSAREHV